MQNLVFVSKDFQTVVGEYLPFENEKAFEYFKAATRAKTCVVSEQMYNIIRKNRPRLKRDFVVFSEQEKLDIPGATVCVGYENLGKILRSKNPDDVILIGGDEGASKLLRFCNSSTVVTTDFKKPTTGFAAGDVGISLDWIKMSGITHGKRHYYEISLYHNVNTIAPSMMSVFDDFIKEDNERKEKAKKQEEFEKMKQVLLSKKINKHVKPNINVDNKSFTKVDVSMQEVGTQGAYYGSYTLSSNGVISKHQKSEKQIKKEKKTGNYTKKQIDSIMSRVK